MAQDVVVAFVSGGKTWNQTFPKIDRVIEGERALRLEVKKYKSLPHDMDYNHVASVPYEHMLFWTEGKNDES